MKCIKISILLCMLYAAVPADISSVSVPAGMLHDPSPAMGLGFTGKVEYTLIPSVNDSIFVSLSIVPAAGGTPLALTSVNGDVGVINVNTNKPGAPAAYTIFFQCAAPQVGQTYVARIIADAVVSSGKVQVDGLLGSMTKTQKATLMGGGGDGFQSNGAGSVPAIYMADGPHGVRPQGGGQATCFPTCAGLACTWDTAMAFLQGQAKGEEFRALGKNCALGPAFDLVYHPQGGRASEYYSEDPYLSGRLAVADVLGLQSRAVIATIKHYACNNKEQNRFNLSANLSERALREIYLYNWMPSIVKAGCWGIMGAYNKVNQSYACSNKFLMTDVLRNEWGYKYLVMTDWGANFDNFTAGIQYGVDIDMPNPDTYVAGTIAGQTDSIVNMHARRILNAHVKIGDLATGYNRSAYTGTLMSQAHRDIARTVGSSAIILAKNTGNVLPIPKTGKKIALTGPFRNQCRLGPGGSSAVNARDRVTPQQGITTLLSSAGAGASTIVTDINQADYIVVFVGPSGETEGGDRANLALQSTEGETDVQAALAVTAAKTIVVYTGGSASSAGNWSKAPAVLIAFYPGQEQGTCIADVLFGNVNPSGKLPVTFPADASQVPPFNLVGANLNYPSSDTAHGYFRINKKNQTPLFAFGHGLSYTTFSYSDLKIFPPQISAGDQVFVSVKVTNTGTVAGKEIVQLYLSMPSANASLPVRVQDLRGFTKVSLAAGASATVTFRLTEEEMRIYNPNGADFGAGGKWQVLAGSYGVRAGTSSQKDLQPTINGAFTVR